MLAEILPPEVAAVEAFGDVLDVELFPEEEAALGRAVDKRRREFTTARACARAALAKLGLPPVPIVPGLRGAPQWPHDVVGSITHCIGYRAAAVARGHDIRTLGLDAEPDEGLPEGVVNRVAAADERAGLRALASATPGPCWDRLLFSAKESIYKAWFPLTRRWLGFEDTVITINPVNGTFTVRLLVPGPVLDGRSLTRFEGRWLVRDGLVLTAIAVPALPQLCHRLCLAWRPLPAQPATLMRVAGDGGHQAPTACTPPSTCTISPVVAGNQSDSSATHARIWQLSDG
jgi:4'-phosphopantetheinyl transferase EntD